LRNKAGCGELTGLWVYVFFLAMLCLPVWCLVSTLKAAPTPEHRAVVEAQEPNPVADWTVTVLAFGGCAVVLVVALAKNGQTVELPGGGYKGPEVVRPCAPGPLTPEAQNHWISDYPLHEAGRNKPWGRPGWKEKR
jgi:hypothetical protein